jgi:hypothetical protein
MTTFSYTATIDDSEFIALDYAIKSYIEICRAKIVAGEDRAYSRHIEILERLMSRFVDGAEMMSARGDIWDAWHKAKAERERKE